MEDEVIRGSIVHQDGAMMWPPPAPSAPPAPATPTKPKEIITAPAKTPWQSSVQETGLVTGTKIFKPFNLFLLSNFCYLSQNL